MARENWIFQFKNHKKWIQKCTNHRTISIFLCIGAMWNLGNLESDIWKKFKSFFLFLELTFRPASRISRRAARVDKYLGGWTSNFYIIMAWRWYVITRTGLRIYEFGICPCLAVEYYWNKLFQIFLSENVFDFSPNWNNISFYFNYQYFSYWLLKPDFLTEK